MTETQTEAEREKKDRERQRGCLHSVPSFLPSCLWSSERVALSNREQLVREGGESKVGGDIWTWTLPDQMSHYDVNSSFFCLFVLYCSAECTDSILGCESCTSDGLSRIEKDKRDQFNLNHLWLIIASAADVCESTQHHYKIIIIKKLIYSSSKCSYLTNCLRKCMPKSSTWK